MRYSILVLLTLWMAYAGANSTRAASGPLYSIEIVSLNQANVFDATGLLIATLTCRAYLETKEPYEYRVDCPRSMNGFVDFTTLLNYDSSEDQWGSVPDVSPLNVDGRPSADVPCSADGTFSPLAPRFPISCTTY